MGRPKGSKNKPKSEDLKLDGGQWLQRNIEKPDIAGMPRLTPIEIPTKNNALSDDELRDWVREESLTYMVELFPSNRIQDSEISDQWKLCQNELIKLKRMIFKD